MSLIDKIKEFIGRHHRPEGEHESPPAEVTVDFWLERERRMTPEERAETLAAAAEQWKKEKAETLDYKNSLVDLLKLTGQESSLQARRKLANEVGWEGNDDTAAMNMHLYPIVLDRLRIVY